MHPQDRRPVGVQAFCPQLAVDRIDEIVVGAPPRSGEVQCRVVDTSPEVDITGDEFTAIVDPDDFG